MLVDVRDGLVPTQADIQFTQGTVVITDESIGAAAPWEEELIRNRQESREATSDKINSSARRILASAGLLGVTVTFPAREQTLKPTGASSPSSIDWDAFYNEDPQMRKILKECWNGARWPIYPWGGDKPVDIFAAHEGPV